MGPQRGSPGAIGANAITSLKQQQADNESVLSTYLGSGGKIPAKFISNKATVFGKPHPVRARTNFDKYENKVVQSSYSSSKGPSVTIAQIESGAFLGKNSNSSLTDTYVVDKTNELGSNTGVMSSRKLSS